MLEERNMTQSISALPSIEDFIQRWKASGASERANYVSFLNELCDQLAVPRPDPAQPNDDLNAYVFESAVTFQNGDGTTSTGRIDLYKRGCFVLEAKQGSNRVVESVPLSGLTRWRSTPADAARG